jgi:hypothetical protein
MIQRSAIFVALLASTAALAVPAMANGASTEAKVTVGSPPTPYLPNGSNEPALAMDANHPEVLAAGANDLVDSSPCKGSSCDLTPDIGISGVYFSFDSGTTWTQPTYTGLTAQNGTTHVGPIHTLPGYFEHGMSSHGDPALAFGPRPGANGTFSWANGSRLYYGNLAFPLSSAPGFAGFSAAVVSRTDDVRAAAAGVQSAWMDPVIASKQNAALLSDKDDIWADNASSSPFFGNVYLCNVAFRGTNSLPEPVVLNTSTDGGSTWRQRQLSPATNSAQTGGRQGCAIRTDSAGVVYVVWEGTDINTRQSVFFLARSFDGGNNFEKARAIAAVHDVGVPDPVSGRIVFDGFAGTRTDSFPSLSIANGAPFGADATNTIVLTWPNGALNHEQALVQTSADRGLTWSAPVNAAQAGDRPDNPAVAISPNGTDVYLVYNAYLQPFQTNTANPRRMQGVTRHADVGPGGVLEGFTTLHRAAVGDARGTTRTLNRELIYDYQYAAASRGIGVTIWMDARDATDCPAVDAYRQSLIDGTPIAAPSPLTDCPPDFGNLDNYSGSFADPTP